MYGEFRHKCQMFTIFACINLRTLLNLFYFYTIVIDFHFMKKIMINF